MREAMHYKKLKNNIVQCQLCPKFCTIKPGDYGNCNARKNIDGTLYSMVYAMPVAAAVDPVEKKPLFHFLPGSKVFSIGTAGCNLHCKFCQNWTTSQINVENIFAQKLLPEDVVKAAMKAKSESIGYTYNEPSIFYEYVIETAKLARKKGLKNIMVTNAFINPEPLMELYRFIDAANVDLKAFDEKYYKECCDAGLKPVLENLKAIKSMGVWLEITNLIVPTLNDDMKKIKKMCEWIVSNLGSNVPLHFSRFFPMYKLDNLPPTPVETLLKAKEIAVKAGIDFVYVGNVHSEIEDNGENTFCPKCKRLIIQRSGFFVLKNAIKNSKCIHCSEKIAGIW